MLCGKELTRTGARQHLAACAPAHDVTSGPVKELLQLRVTSPGLPAYWLDVEVRLDAKLEALDAFLRRTWLECCGHLSAFSVGSVKYFSRGYELGFMSPLGGSGGVSERSMAARLVDALPGIGGRFGYEYDFGATTMLQLSVVAERTGRIGRSAVRLLARNTAPSSPCASCGQPASMVCSFCLSQEEHAFACALHVTDHGCGETDGFMPVVNSPRMGVCGYGVEN